MTIEVTLSMKLEKAMFGAGCFWGVEAAFRRLPGVIETSVGYSGGSTADPTYEEVCTGQTGHAEVVCVEFDSAVLSYAKLLDFFWSIHDPTTLNRQGPDVGSQYRSVVFYYDEGQRAMAQAVKEKIRSSGRFKNEIVTQLLKAQVFYRAEEYHQRYSDRHGFC